MEKKMQVRWMWISMLPALAACHQFPPGVCRTGVDVPVEVRLAFNDTSNVPMALREGVPVSGLLVSPGTMRVDAVQVQIGNNGGMSSGMLALRLCQAGRCVQGKADVASVKGNDYLTIDVKPSLPISYTAGPIRYDLTRLPGNGELRLWTYPSVSAVAGIEDQGHIGPQTLNLVFRQQ